MNRNKPKATGSAFVPVGKSTDHRVIADTSTWSSLFSSCLIKFIGATTQVLGTLRFQSSRTYFVIVDEEGTYLASRQSCDENADDEERPYDM